MKNSLRKIAQVGMWLMESSDDTLVAERFGQYFARLPFKPQCNNNSWYTL